MWFYLIFVIYKWINATTRKTEEKVKTTVHTDQMYVPGICILVEQKRYKMKHTKRTRT